MSAVVAESVSKPSRVYNLYYVIFGYVVAASLISPSKLELSDYILLVAIGGGFLGTFLFFIKPVKMLLYVYMNRRFGASLTAFNSPYLSESKDKIAGGFYFTLSSVVVAVSPNASIFVGENQYLRILIVLLGIIALLFSLARALRFHEKIRVVIIYYRNLTEGYLDRASIPLLRVAFERGDFEEVNAIISSEREEYK